MYVGTLGSGWITLTFLKVDAFEEVGDPQELGAEATEEDWLLGSGEPQAEGAAELREGSGDSQESALLVDSTPKLDTSDDKSEELYDVEDEVIEGSGDPQESDVEELVSEEIKFVCEELQDDSELDESKDELKELEFDCEEPYEGRSELGSLQSDGAEFTWGESQESDVEVEGTEFTDTCGDQKMEKNQLVRS